MAKWLKIVGIGVLLVPLLPNTLLLVLLYWLTALFGQFENLRKQEDSGDSMR